MVLLSPVHCMLGYLRYPLPLIRFRLINIFLLSEKGPLVSAFYYYYFFVSFLPMAIFL
jgi:hypothetical protein